MSTVPDSSAAPQGSAPQGLAPQGYAAPPQPADHLPGAPPYAQMPGVPAHAQHARPTGPVGSVRGTGVAMLLFVVTLGIYGLYYHFVTHEEMKKHSGEGIGGVLGLVLVIFAGIASPFVLSHEVGALYERTGRAKPVGAATGLWAVLGALILVGPIVWFVKTNGALNAYWRTAGAR